MTNAHDYYDSLPDAIKAARAQSEDQTGGLSAQRRDYGDGEYSWRVTFDDDPAVFMTVISDENVSKMTDAEIAQMIEACWDAEWDDRQINQPVGDFSHGSSDWTA